ncbi:putative transcription factor bHLH041 isoform X2 [Benincasa hispida]|uniref:putative transcription factor bHLH041 isoform X2 n=1 Tax=Benincasa hispida TaxID=102211 RepID=UPI0018FFEBCD|nr:putative transcription factor bHLH041 isoform X2 [Benincasa hispida]
MEIVFSLPQAARANFLQSIMQSFHSTYISLWSYLPHPSNCLLNLDGFYGEDDDRKKQPSSSLGSFERRLFNEYTQLIFNLENSLVPGYAFKNNISFLEVQESVLQTHSSSQIQRQFYASVVFMGSSNGEVELGFSEVNMVEKMKKTNPLIPGWEEVSSMIVLQNSASIEEISPESPSLFLYDDLSKILLPQPPAPPSGKPPCSSLLGGLRGSAFEDYNVKKKAAAVAEDHRKRESLMKKCIVFYRKLKIMRGGERIVARLPASAQLLHMIAERRRREKLNQSFLALRSILPPQTKKDKASVLATTREYLTKLKAQVSELSHKNQMLLEAQALHNRKHDQSTTATSSLNERFTVNVSYAPPGSTEEIIDLEITVRGDGPLMADIAICVLQFLKNIVNVRVVLSFHANHQTHPSSLTRLGFRFSLQVCFIFRVFFFLLICFYNLFQIFLNCSLLFPLYSFGNSNFFVFILLK